jgi:hypothetical protein
MHIAMMMTTMRMMTKRYNGTALPSSRAVAPSGPRLVGMTTFILKMAGNEVSASNDSVRRTARGNSQITNCIGKIPIVTQDKARIKVSVFPLASANVTLRCDMYAG